MIELVLDDENQREDEWSIKKKTELKWNKPNRSNAFSGFDSTPHVNDVVGRKLVDVPMHPCEQKVRWSEMKSKLPRNPKSNKTIERQGIRIFDSFNLSWECVVF